MTFPVPPAAYAYFGVPVPGSAPAERKKYEPEHFDQLTAFQGMMGRAKERCNEIAANEKVWGYNESFAVYTEMAVEAMVLYEWMREVLP